MFSSSSDICHHGTKRRAVELGDVPMDVVWRVIAPYMKDIGGLCLVSCEYMQKGGQVYTKEHAHHRAIKYAVQHNSVADLHVLWEGWISFLHPYQIGRASCRERV